MVYDVILTQANNRFIARAKEWPDVVVEDETKEGVLDRIKKRLLDYLTNQIEVVQIELSIPTNATNPWLDKFGWFKEDPTFDDLQAEIAAYRQELDEEMEQVAA